MTSASALSGVLIVVLRPSRCSARCSCSVLVSVSGRRSAWPGWIRSGSSAHDAAVVAPDGPPAGLDVAGRCRVRAGDGPQRVAGPDHVGVAVVAAIEATGAAGRPDVAGATARSGSGSPTSTSAPSPLEACAGSAVPTTTAAPHASSTRRRVAPPLRGAAPATTSATVTEVTSQSQASASASPVAQAATSAWGTASAVLASVTARQVAGHGVCRGRGGGRDAEPDGVRLRGADEPPRHHTNLSFACVCFIQRVLARRVNRSSTTSSAVAATDAGSRRLPVVGGR